MRKHTTLGPPLSLPHVCRRATHLTSSAHCTNPLPPNLSRRRQWGECDDNVYTTVQNGANVIIWFATNLASDEDGNAAITGGPNRDCVVEKINTVSGGCGGLVEFSGGG